VYQVAHTIRANFVEHHNDCPVAARARLNPQTLGSKSIEGRSAYRERLGQASLSALDPHGALEGWMNRAKPLLTGVSGLLLALATFPSVSDTAFSANSGSPEIYAALPASELDALVAPIALYPDALLAQVLGAATYPDQVVAANQYLKVNGDLRGDALREQVESRGWDPAVQALTQFPSVLEQLAKNITWTSALGDAAANQQADVMAAIQRMRARAYTAGNLKSGTEITVVQQGPQVIVIEPAKPNVVYVPSYNPTVIYGAPVAVPGYTSQDVVAASVIGFGVGVVVAAAVSSGSCGFGMSWGMGWSSSSIHCGGGMYYGNPYWRGGYYPGYYPGYRPPYYYPPPRPPGGAPPRPVHPIAPPTGPGVRPGGTRPGTPSTLPARPPVGARPAGPGTLPSTGGGTRPGGPSTLPATGGGTRPTTPSQRPSDRAARGYAPGTQPSRPNAFSGSGGGRAQSARGNSSMGAGGPARTSAGGRRQ
jgi:hypothetical protein